jgi:hypothetical protein
MIESTSLVEIYRLDEGYRSAASRRLNARMNHKLPSDALKKPTRRLPWIVGGVGAAAVAVAAVFAGPSIAATLNSAPVPTPTMTPYVATLTPAELESVQAGADQQAAIIAADEAAAEKAAADAAAQAAADAAAKKAASSWPIKCPVGSSANSGDGPNDTSCLPTICFHLTLPDPAHPECDTAFKP